MVQSEGLSAENVHFLQKWIHRESGFVIDQGNSYLLHSRLTRVLERERLQSVDALCARLRGSAPSIARQVIEAMTTHETFFFRDKAPFDALRNHIVPTLINGPKNGRRLTLWSAAASSGQESYSLAMLLLEMGLNSHEVDIFATDLSNEALRKARLGTYGRFDVNRGLPEGYLERYFEPSGTEWQVKDHVRKMVRFQQLDLRSSLRSYGPFDLVLCRNVLIYFDTATKAKILGEIRRTLHHGGYLLLGAAETVNLAGSFERTSLGQTTVYRAV